MSDDYVEDTDVSVGTHRVGHRFRPATSVVVTLYSCDNYGEDPQWLDPSEARAVAAALVAAADEADRQAAEQPPICTTCCRAHGVDGWNPRHLPTD